MTETMLLVILAILILGIIYSIRRLVASRQITPLVPRIEAVIRIALCLLFAFIAHAYYAGQGSRWGLTFGVAVVLNGLVIYAVTHLLDRLVLR